jgi:hypothetical protein
MGKIGFGYGSEYQLMRLMGRHLNEFNLIVKKSMKLSTNIVWHDFRRTGLLDHEIMNIDFISSNTIRNQWNEIWPTNSNNAGINWDAVGCSNDVIIIVEAKAHAQELFQSMGATNIRSIDMIRKAFSNLCNDFQIQLNDSWFDENYQLANHLVAVHFLNSRGFKAKLLNLYFIHGYEIDAHGKKKDHSLSVKSQEEWQKIIDEQHNKMRISGNQIEEYITNIFIDC